jgi:hypothetical protein
MVTNVKNILSLHKLASSRYYVTPSNTGDIGEHKCKRVRLSSPMSPHAIKILRISAVAETSSGDTIWKEGGNMDIDSDNEEVEFDDNRLPYKILDSVVAIKN